MQVVPVIDLKDGAVVHARGGQRDRYAPIRSPLTDSSQPLDVVAALLSLHPFQQLYVADLDAIAGGAGHGFILRALRESFPGLTLWVDAGLRDLAACRAWLAQDLGDPVLGSESLANLDGLEDLGDGPLFDRALLSLDFRGEAFQGPAELPSRPELWPARILVMTLARVGALQGPDCDRLTMLRARAPDRRVFAAGGVRNRDDLTRLHGLGAAGALVASCLHNENLTAADLDELQAEIGSSA